MTGSEFRLQAEKPAKAGTPNPSVKCWQNSSWSKVFTRCSRFPKICCTHARHSCEGRNLVAASGFPPSREWQKNLEHRATGSLLNAHWNFQHWNLQGFQNLEGLGHHWKFQCALSIVFATEHTESTEQEDMARCGKRKSISPFPKTLWLNGGNMC